MGQSESSAADPEPERRYEASFESDEFRDEVVEEEQGPASIMLSQAVYEEYLAPPENKVAPVSDSILKSIMDIVSEDKTSVPSPSNEDLTQTSPPTPIVNNNIEEEPSEPTPEVPYEPKIPVERFTKEELEEVENRAREHATRECVIEAEIQEIIYANTAQENRQEQIAKQLLEDCNSLSNLITSGQPKKLCNQEPLQACAECIQRNGWSNCKEEIQRYTQSV